MYVKTVFLKKVSGLPPKDSKPSYAVYSYEFSFNVYFKSLLLKAQTAKVSS